MVKYAEIEFSALSNQCLDLRIGSIEELDKEVPAWVKGKNEKKIKINWLFDTPQARCKLKRHYTKVNPANEPFLNSDKNTITASNN